MQYATNKDTSPPPLVGTLLYYARAVDMKDTNMCFFIQKSQVLTAKQPTYSWIICNFCPQKKEQNRTCLKIGGN